MTAAFSEIRFRGSDNNMDDSNSLVENADIPHISHLIVMPSLNERVTVIGADYSKIELRANGGDMLKQLEYTISGDTLTLHKINLREDQRIDIAVYVNNDHFNSLSADDSGVTMKELNLNSLAIHQTAGWIRINDSNRLQNLQITANKSADLSFRGARLDTLSIDGDDSRMIILCSVNRIQGNMTNESYLKVDNAKDIAFKMDESSSLNLN
jgi:hypothetical protein